MLKHTLIGGGTGFIGTGLSKCLRTHGYTVTKISRMPGPDHMTWHDLENRGIPESVTSVVNLAGQNVLDPSRRWTDGFKQNVWNSRINSSRALASAIELAPNVHTFINISGVSHYPPDENKTYTEYDKVEGFDFMSKLCLEWEKAAELSPQAANHCKQVKIRTGVVIGREGGMIQSLWLPFQLGLGGPLGSGKQILPWIHLSDLCGLIRYCIENDGCRGVLNAVAPEITTNGEFSKVFASTLHRPCFCAVPEFMVNVIFGKDRSSLLLSGAKINPKRTIQSGFEFKYPTVKSAVSEVIKSKMNLK